MDSSAKVIRVLFIYSYRDKNLCEELAKHVRVLERNLDTPLTLWCDQDIQAGQDREREINHHLEDADVILLLVSANFFDSSYCQEEMEKALKRCNEDETRIIPVILRPILWEGTDLGHLQALPTNGIPVTDSRWGSQQAAFNNISLGLQKTIKHLLEAKKIVGEQYNTNEEDDPIVPITLFNQTSSIPLFSYLTLPTKDSDSDVTRIFRVRTIMQIFYQNYKALHGPTSEQEICQDVQRRVGIEYSPQECKRDLTFLIQHGNLVPSDERTKTATSIAAFEASIHNKFYQATADALSIENFIEERLQISNGTLNKSSLYNIKRHLKIIDDILSKPPLGQEDGEMLAENWDEAFGIWRKWLALALSYLSNLEVNEQNEQYDIEKYMDYKNIVVSYIQRFARVLLDVTHSINELFSSWSQGEKVLLIEYISQHKYKSSPPASNKEPLSSIADQISKQITELETWFQRSAHSFHDRAVTEIQRVVNRATLLALYLRSHVNNVTVLRELALQFMDIADVDTAKQVFDATFANALPVHLSEKFTGHAKIIEQSENHSVWNEPPTVHPRLLPIKPGRPGERRTEDPIEEDQPKIQELYAGQIRQERDRQQRFTRLFAQILLNIGTLTSIEPQDRAILEEIIDTCLNDTASHQYQDPDQTNVIIVLLNPDEQAYIRLCSSDGILSIPCYRLKRQ